MLALKSRDEISALKKEKQFPHFTDEEWRLWLLWNPYDVLARSVNPPLWATDYVREDVSGVRPVKYIRVSKPNAGNTMARLLADLGFFRSAKEAKRNGWNIPPEVGEYWFRKKTYCLIIT